MCLMERARSTVVRVSLREIEFYRLGPHGAIKSGR